jgi:hypothetical protein
MECMLKSLSNTSFKLTFVHIQDWLLVNGSKKNWQSMTIQQKHSKKKTKMHANHNNYNNQRKQVILNLDQCKGANETKNIWHLQCIYR